MSKLSINKGASMAPGLPDQSFHGDEAFAIAHPWVRHYEQGVPISIAVPDHPLTWLLDCAAQRYPHHTAFIYYGTKIPMRSSLNSRIALPMHCGVLV